MENRFISLSPFLTARKLKWKENREKQGNYKKMS